MNEKTESPPANATPDLAGLAETLVGVGNQTLLAEAAGPGPGPKRRRIPVASMDFCAGAPPLDAAGNPVAGAPFDAEAVRALVDAVLTGLDEAATEFQRTLAAQAGGTEFGDKVAERVKFKEPWKTLVAANAVVVFEKYRFDAKFLPEISLLVGSIGLVVPHLTSYAALKRALKAAKAQEKAKDEIPTNNITALPAK